MPSCRDPSSCTTCRTRSRLRRALRGSGFALYISAHQASLHRHERPAPQSPARHEDRSPNPTRVSNCGAVGRTSRHHTRTSPRSRQLASNPWTTPGDSLPGVLLLAGRLLVAEFRARREEQINPWLWAAQSRERHRGASREDADCHRERMGLPARHRPAGDDPNGGAENGIAQPVPIGRHSRHRHV